MGDTESSGGFTRAAAATSWLWGAELDFERPEWFDAAECRGTPPGVFYTERGENARVRKAKQICRGCDVRAECLEFALSTGEKHGVWGGLSERERRRLRRLRALAALREAS